MPERPAERDVHLLEAAAHGEQRHAARDRVRDQWQGRRVAVRVVQRVRIARLARVPVRLDVRRAAGQQDAVERPEQLVEVALTERRDQHRDRLGGVDHGGDVLLPHAVERVRTEDPAIRRDADQRFVASHV
jgi:hypothetical protein